jgi:hypothetical protein
LAVLLTPRLGEQQLQALDLEPEGGDHTDLTSDYGIPLGKLRLGDVPCRALGTQHRMRSGKIVWQGIEAIHADNSNT